MQEIDWDRKEGLEEDRCKFRLTEMQKKIEVDTKGLDWDKVCLFHLISEIQND